MISASTCTYMTLRSYRIASTSMKKIAPKVMTASTNTLKMTGLSVLTTLAGIANSVATLSQMYYLCRETGLKEGTASKSVH